MNNTRNLLGGEKLLSSGTHPYLSIVIPAHNEEHRLPACLDQIDTFLSTQPFDYEVIIIENGSKDNTYEIACHFAKTHPYVQAIKVETRGKGLAVKAGMLAADGDYRFICDVDLSMPIDQITHFLPPDSDGYDISIATREGKEARRVNEPEYRHIMGRINNWLIKLFAVRGFEDTQCGFKMFNRETAEDLFDVQRMSGIGFDVELIFVAQKRGYRIREVPITWYFDPDSRMRLVEDSLRMLQEIWDIRRNWRKGLYVKKETAKDR